MPSDSRTLLENYIRDHVCDMLKAPRRFIRYPFIDPGSVYDGNVWDWDTYWSVRGLLSLSDLFPEEVNRRILEHARGNVLNFLDHQQPDGYVPIMIEAAQWPEPYLVMRHREGVRMNTHKPFLVQQTVLISRFQGDWGWAAGFFGSFEKYFEYYETYFDPACGLYKWHDDIMIGMDNDPASFGRPPDSTASVFLNSFMVMELQAMADLADALGRPAAPWLEKKDALVRAVLRECWDGRDGFSYSVDTDIRTRKYDWFHQGLGVFWKTLPIRIRTWSGFLPLLAGFATPAQAALLAREAENERTFKSPFGVCTLEKKKKMFDLSATSNPSNWLGPIWLVANYCVFRGLKDYGFSAEAERIARGSLSLLARDLEKTGCLHEYYRPDSGEPVMNGGFINWNILALTMQRETEE